MTLKAISFFYVLLFLSPPVLLSGLIIPLMKFFDGSGELRSGFFPMDLNEEKTFAMKQIISLSMNNITYVNETNQYSWNLYDDVSVSMKSDLNYSLFMNNVGNHKSYFTDVFYYISFFCNVLISYSSVFIGLVLMSLPSSVKCVGITQNIFSFLNITIGIINNCISFLDEGGGLIFQGIEMKASMKSNLILLFFFFDSFYIRLFSIVFIMGMNLVILIESLFYIDNHRYFAINVLLDEKYWKEQGFSVVFLKFLLDVLFYVTVFILFMFKFSPEKQEKEKDGKILKKIEVIKEDIDDLVAEKEAEMKFLPKIRIKNSLIEIKYEDLTIVKKLGKGGSIGTVFLCKYKGNEVAFKIFDVDASMSDNKFEEFEIEVNMLANLRHPHILQFFGATVSKENRIGIVMEYCSNGDLNCFLSSMREIDKKVSIIEKLRILKEVCSACEFVHERGILHRDLKGDNVFIDKNGSAKIADFGLSKVTTFDLTNTMRVGTATHMAPEVASCHSYDHRCDIYSFGMLIYEIINEKKPYYERKIVSIEQVVAKNPNFRPKVDEVNFEECKWIIEVMRKCWEHKMEDRYNSFKEIFDIFTNKMGSKNGKIHENIVNDKNGDVKELVHDISEFEKAINNVRSFLEGEIKEERLKILKEFVEEVQVKVFKS